MERVDRMHKVLIVGSIEYNTRLLECMPVWGPVSDFTVERKVHNGLQGLNLLRQESFDMVITEIHVTGLDGLQLLRHINQEKLCSIVVILSDTVEFQYVRECIMFGAFDYLKKMPDVETVLALLHRAKEKLLSDTIPLAATVEHSYPVLKEERILQYFFERNEEAIRLFSNTLEEIYKDNHEQLIQKDLLAKKLYSNLITKIFGEYKWLYHYVEMDTYKKLDYLWVNSTNGFQDFFLHKLKQLFDFINRLFLHTQDKSLKSLLEYILNNPEEDLKLKTVVEKVFLNYSYLSSNFYKKLGIHYNEHIVSVKMARAAFLLLNTDMKVYEICTAVSYQDTNYFARQFRKVYGLTPTEFKLGSVQTESLDFACL